MSLPDAIRSIAADAPAPLTCLRLTDQGEWAATFDVDGRALSFVQHDEGPGNWPAAFEEIHGRRKDYASAHEARVDDSLWWDLCLARLDLLALGREYGSSLFALAFADAASSWDPHRARRSDDDDYDSFEPETWSGLPC